MADLVVQDGSAKGLLDQDEQGSGSGGAAGAQRKDRDPGPAAAPTPSEPAAPAATAPAVRASVRLSSQGIGQLPGEVALAVPAASELTDEWGDDTQEFGRDPQIGAFLDQVIERFQARKRAAEKAAAALDGEEEQVSSAKPQKKKAHAATLGDPGVIRQLNRDFLAKEFLLLKAFHLHTKKKSVQQLKHNWLFGMLSRLDVATLPSAYDWPFTPATEKAPAEVAFPPKIDSHGTSKKQISRAIARFLVELEKTASAHNFKFRAQNRDGHSSGHAVDMYLKDWPHKGETLDGYNFWDAEAAAEFLSFFEAAANAARLRSWHVLYNDPRVIREVNHRLHRDSGVGRVAYGGSYRIAGGKKHKELRDLVKSDATIQDPKMLETLRKVRRDEIEENYHGPDPVLLHFHVDVISDAPEDHASGE